MPSLFNQIISVVLMGIKGIRARVWSSVSAYVSVSVVVTVLLVFQALNQGFQYALTGSGAEDTAIILRKDTSMEMNSALTSETVKLISLAPGIRKSTSGQPLVSNELYVVVNAFRKSSQSEVNVPLRGLSSGGEKLRGHFQLIAGRMYNEGVNEIIVGQSVQQQVRGLELGNDIELGGVKWKVVGVFADAGGVSESELWSSSLAIQAHFNRQGVYQIVRAKLVQQNGIDALVQYFDSDARLNLDVMTEKRYYAGQASGVSTIIKFVGWPLVVMMSLGALAGALNTMYTSVHQRTREIATLRAIGFNGSAAFIGTFIEALGLALAGGVSGAAIAYLFFDGVSASTMGGGSFSQVFFNFRMSADIVKDGLILALIIGFIGGLFPAWRATRIPVISAFK
ncbi:MULTISPECIES: ABC transporter permease [unclassified Pseudoalteromonas]|uniref:ABC transporter permease n=1 Tax=unclassified Pseudoalteromonas TaxID=194690 RepID=UPI0025B519EE|nr:MULTISPECIES: ABC transporter permease [unclassified Pseudoalteromonas]MDN3379168.1 ABC transporter permease [Pseudoalteromonas sp. APC 3893]MDN3387663.1 ABC transporter permease [Pseudoalteromonas sp. APC 4017]